MDQQPDILTAKVEGEKSNMYNEYCRITKRMKFIPCFHCRGGKRMLLTEGKCEAIVLEIMYYCNNDVTTGLS